LEIVTAMPIHVHRTVYNKPLDRMPELNAVVERAFKAGRSQLSLIRATF